MRHSPGAYTWRARARRQLPRPRAGGALSACPGAGLPEGSLASSAYAVSSPRSPREEEPHRKEGPAGKENKDVNTIMKKQPGRADWAGEATLL